MKLFYWNDRKLAQQLICPFPSWEVLFPLKLRPPGWKQGQGAHWILGSMRWGKGAWESRDWEGRIRIETDAFDSALPTWGPLASKLPTFYKSKSFLTGNITSCCSISFWWCDIVNSFSFSLRYLSALLMEASMFWAHLCWPAKGDFFLFLAILL